MPVRVLHLIDSLQGGGSERWLWDIVRLSDPERCQHRVITIVPTKGTFVYAERLRAKGAYHQRATRRRRRRDEKKSRQLTQGPPSERSGQPKPQTVGRRLKAALYVARAWPHVLWALVRFRPHVVHVHTFRGFRSGVFLKVVFRLPLVHTIPCLFSQMEAAGHEWMPGLYRDHHRRVDCFLTGASLDEPRQVGIPDAKVVPIEGVIDLSAVREARSKRESHRLEVRQRLGLAPDARIALSVGRLDPSKGHGYALEALAPLMKQRADLHWLVLGAGRQEPVLRGRAAELGVSDRVHLLGFQPDPLPYYAAATLYLRTPIYEGENLASYQAMGLGLPVVGFATGCETERIDQVGHGILVQNENSAELSRAIAQVLDLPDEGRSLGARGRAYAEENLDIGRAIESFTRVYEDLRAGRTATGSRKTPTPTS